MRNIISIIVTVCIMGILCGVTINKITENYERELAKAEESYEQQIENANLQYEKIEEKYEKLAEQNDELEEQVYNLMNGETYEITLRLKDGTHTYKATANGIWGYTDKHHYVTN